MTLHLTPVRQLFFSHCLICTFSIFAYKIVVTGDREGEKEPRTASSNPR
jgi:hypothetical protein